MTSLPLIRVLAAEGQRVRLPDLNDQPAPTKGDGVEVQLTTFIRIQLAEKALVQVDEEGNPVTKPDAIDALGATESTPQEGSGVQAAPVATDAATGQSPEAGSNPASGGKVRGSAAPRSE